MKCEICHKRTAATANPTVHEDGEDGLCIQCKNDRHWAIQRMVDGVHAFCGTIWDQMHRRKKLSTTVPMGRRKR